MQFNIELKAYSSEKYFPLIFPSSISFITTLIRPIEGKIINAIKENIYWIIIPEININTKYKKEKIKLKISGEIKLIAEDELLIDFAEVIPYLNEKKVIESKIKLKIISKLILQVLLRQFPFLNQIDIFCSIYYAKKAKDYFSYAFQNENMEFEENITFIYINIV